MCGIIDLRIDQLADAIGSELRHPTPDAQRVELLELQQASCADFATRLIRMTRERCNDTSPISARLCASTTTGE